MTDKDSKTLESQEKRNRTSFPRFRAPPSDSRTTGPPRNENPPLALRKIILSDARNRAERKVPGLKNYGLDHSTKLARQQQAPAILLHETSVEEMEDRARHGETRNPFYLMYLGNLAALRTVAYYLTSVETYLCVSLTVGLTLYWYYEYDGDETWNGGSLDFILLSFVVISPISAAIGMAFQRRERALISISTFRTFAYQLYLAHCLWDWTENGGREAKTDVNWLAHGDAVLAQLIGIGDELSRFLTLPTTSRSRHRMTRRGRREASVTVEAAYHLIESMSTQRMTRLSLYAERLKAIGLPSGEVSRLRQYERFISDSIEQLRLVKMYRTPQALRSLARIFTLILPPFYAPSFAQVARDVNSLGVGIANGVIVALALTGLFLSLEVLEDPFTAFLALDGVDCREEFEVLHYAQLIHTRDLIFPDAPVYPAARRAALRNVKGGGSVFDIAGKRTHETDVPLDVGEDADALDDESILFAHFDDVELGMPMDIQEDIRESGFVEEQPPVWIRARAGSRGSLLQHTARSTGNLSTTVGRHHRRVVTHS